MNFFNFFTLLFERHIFRVLQSESESVNATQKMILCKKIKKNHVKNDSFLDKKHKILIKNFTKVDS